MTFHDIFLYRIHSPDHKHAHSSDTGKFEGLSDTTDSYISIFNKNFYYRYKISHISRFVAIYCAKYGQSYDINFNTIDALQYNHPSKE